MTRWFCGIALGPILGVSPTLHQQLLQTFLVPNSNSTTENSSSLPSDFNSDSKHAHLSEFASLQWQRELQEIALQAGQWSAAAEQDIHTQDNTKEKEKENVESKEFSALLTSDQHLQQASVDIAGMLIPKRANTSSDPTSLTSHNQPVSPSQLVLVPSTMRNLRRLALALACWSPVLLSGPPGCGKSCLLEEVGLRTGFQRDLVRLQLDDQIDSKTLLGTYTCTDIPGEFKWQPGALTQAVLNGRWVVIEDIDKAPFEVISAIITLLERRQLFLAGRGEVLEAHPSFRIFATRTTGSSFAPGQSTSLVDGLFATVHCEPLSGPEVCILSP